MFMYCDFAKSCETRTYRKLGFGKIWRRSSKIVRKRKMWSSCGKATSQPLLSWSPLYSRQRRRRYNDLHFVEAILDYDGGVSSVMKLSQPFLFPQPFHCYQLSCSNFIISYLAHLNDDKYRLTLVLISCTPSPPYIVQTLMTFTSLKGCSNERWLSEAIINKTSCRTLSCYTTLRDPWQQVQFSFLQWVRYFQQNGWANHTPDVLFKSPSFQFSLWDICTERAWQSIRTFESSNFRRGTVSAKLVEVFSCMYTRQELSTQDNFLS